MTAPNPNTLWARTLTDELARAGLEHATMAPGSRSTPLVLAMARHDAITLHVHLDERSAAFHALGTGKATGAPGAVITTSGTAAANLHPAIIEAHHSQTPLLALTADRPHRLRGADANQAIDQIKLYGDHVRTFHELAPPTPDPDALAHLRTLADRAIADTQPPHAGPVHLNLPFAKPLDETPTHEIPSTLNQQAPEAVEGRPNNAPYTRITTHPQPPNASTINALAERLEQATRPILVAGPHPRPSALGPAAINLAKTLEAPLLADPLSGARFAPGAPTATIAHASLFLDEDTTRTQLDPDLILRIGQSPTNHPITDWLHAHAATHQILIDDGPIWKDHEALAHEHHRADPAGTLSQLAQHAPSTQNKPWTSTWRTLETRTRSLLEDELHEDPFEATILTHATQAVPEHGQLLVGNSMPIRDLDAYVPPHEDPIKVLANRGASGIDGLVSTAIGAAVSTQAPTLAVLGDLSLLHDINGLHALARSDPPVVFLVINNDGGGIFHRLPIHEHDAFTEHFATPHGLNFQDAASLHDQPYQHLEDPRQLGPILEQALGKPRGQLIEVASDREHNEARHRRVEEAVRAMVQDELSLEEQT